MAPDRLATLDRLRADEATRDVLARLDALARDRAWPRSDAAYARLVWLWQCSVTGRDPDDTAPPTAADLVLLGLELL